MDEQSVVHLAVEMAADEAGMVAGWVDLGPAVWWSENMPFGGGSLVILV